MRGCSTAVAMILVLLIAGHSVLAAMPSRAIAAELLGGMLGGVAGAGLGIVAIGNFAPNLESRAARTATAASGVTLGGGLGATIGFNWSSTDPG
jgi:hypothetical protein